jgi:hypothetical protein
MIIYALFIEKINDLSFFLSFFLICTLCSVLFSTAAAAAAASLKEILSGYNLNATSRQSHAIFHATDRQSHAIFVCDWRSVAYKLYPSGHQSHANLSQEIRSGQA